jgi:hypothetical protein
MLKISRADFQNFMFTVFLSLLPLSVLSVTPAKPPVPVYTVELSVYRLDCSQATDRSVKEAVKGAGELLWKKCGVRLKSGRIRALAARPGWCSLPYDEKERLRVCDEMALLPRRKEPGRLTLFLVPKTQDSRLSWTQVEEVRGGPRKTGCAADLDPVDLVRFGSLFFTDLAWETIRAHDQGSEGLDRPWFKVLLAHEIVHALAQVRHPTRRRDNNLMADRLADMGTDIDPDQCACLKKSPYVKKLIAHR